MTLSVVINNTGVEPHPGLKRDTYLAINFFLAGIILLILIYSGVFSPDKDVYPVVCIHEKITGEQCASCGLSHSLSLIMRGRIAEAYKWNPNGMGVFIFFVSQFMLRIFFSRVYKKHPAIQMELILVDIAGSLILFLIAFMPFIISIFKWL